MCRFLANGLLLRGQSWVELCASGLGIPGRRHGSGNRRGLSLLWGRKNFHSKIFEVYTRIFSTTVGKKLSLDNFVGSVILFRS